MDFLVLHGYAVKIRIFDMLGKQKVFMIFHVYSHHSNTLPLFLHMTTP